MSFVQNGFDVASFDEFEEVLGDLVHLGSVDILLLLGIDERLVGERDGAAALGWYRGRLVTDVALGHHAFFVLILVHVVGLVVHLGHLGWLGLMLHWGWLVVGLFGLL